MPRLDDLSPDLRATLSLLVDRGKSYAEVAELLGIPESAVRDRAHAALDALAGAPQEGGPTFARAAAPPPSAGASSRSGRAASARAASGHGAGDAAGARQSAFASSTTMPVSRRGGALLLGGIAAVIVVVVVLLTSGGGGGGSSSGASASTNTPAHTTSSGSTGTSSTSTSTSGSKAKVTNQLTLTAPDPTSKTVGIAEILAEGSQHAIYVAAEHLPPTHNFFYVLWLYNSPSSAEAIGKTTVNSTARMQAGALLPANAASFHQLLLTRETAEHPSQPGPTVLSGAFSLGH